MESHNPAMFQSPPIRGVFVGGKHPKMLEKTRGPTAPPLLGESLPNCTEQEPDGRSGSADGDVTLEVGCRKSKVEKPMENAGTRVANLEH